MKITKSLPELIEELVEVSWQLEKAKYSNPQRVAGWIKTTWIMGYALEFGYGKNQIKQKLVNEINDLQAELDEKMSEVCGKVEL